MSPILLTLFMFFMNSSIFNCEVFTAISHLKALVDVEKKLTNFLERYVADEEMRLSRIISMYDPSKQLINLNFTNKNEVEKYVGNPIKSYQMLRRVLQFGSVEKLIQVDFTKGIN